MNKIKSIAKREYLVKVKKKSFIIITIVMPLVFLLIMALPFLMVHVQTGMIRIAILDEKGLFKGNIEGTGRMQINFIEGDVEELKNVFSDEYDALLHIPNFDLQYLGDINLFAKKQVGLTAISQLEKRIEYIIERARFDESGFDKEIIDRLRANVSIKSFVLSEMGEKEGNYIASSSLGMIMGFCMYFIIFTYGGMVMASIVSEKKNRIIEILVSSVRPIEIMIGKIIGMAGVALTQLFIWIVLGSIIFAFFTVGTVHKLENSHEDVHATMSMHANMVEQNNTAMQIANFFNDPGAVHLPTIAWLFAFYFIFAYLFYATLYAAIGALTDDDGQSQQLSMIVSILVILSMVIMLTIADNPHNPIVLWASIVPFSAPIVMMARLPFNVPLWQIILSTVVLFFSFLGSAWVSGKIYRTAIMLYGKKLTWKDLWKIIRM